MHRKSKNARRVNKIKAKWIKFVKIAVRKYLKINEIVNSWLRFENNLIKLKFDKLIIRFGTKS